MTYISRRDFLKDAALAAGALALGPQALAADQVAKTRVVVVTCPDVLAKDGPVNAGALRKMMDAGISALFGKRDVKEAWKTYIKPTDTVALADSGTWLLNVPEVLTEIMRGVSLAGPKSATLTYCAMDETHTDYLGKIRDGLKTLEFAPSVMDGSVYTIRSQYHTKNYSSLIVAPTIKSHPIAGVSGVVKHLSTMSKGGPAPHHPNAMESAGAVIVPEFGKMKQLYVVDGLRWGPPAGPHYYQKSLIFSTDPVAADVVALDLFLKNCKTHGEIPPDRHRVLADTKYKAGTSDKSKMDIRQIRV
ncbi:MAG TPA: twin-arginine translocation signal domain-containing protein [Armatimonadota bacterium]|jgi:hypothetical protein